MSTKDEIDTLKNRIDLLERRVEIRDRTIEREKQRADDAEIERDRWKAIADSAVDSENLTIEKLMLTEIELENARLQQQTTERLLEVERSLVGALEDVVRATSRLREQA